MKLSHLKPLALIAGVAAALALTGCTSGTSTGLHGTRATIYSSVADLAADSSQVVVGTVTEQREANDLSFPSTISTISVKRSLPATALGTRLSQKGATAASTVEVRQIGGASMQETPAPILQKGKTYLLFLTPSMLDGAAASQFYVTGGDAGIFGATGAGFGRLSTENPDKLPSRLSETDLTK